ncbi:MAG: T9SS type A sorting domain-containing protein [Bacteroidia bacterium]
MKKLIISGAALLLLSTFAKAQAPVGLDSVIVEKYYVSDANDQTMDATGGTLPLHSVTYRIYVDMKPGYKFQAAYGVDVAPHGGAPSAGDHELRLQTTTSFFNNIDRGATTPAFTKSQAQNNTVMLDSWLSVGGACNGQMGVLKADDNGVANATNADGVLQNNDAYAGIPLTTQDGFIAGTPEAVTFVGVANDILVLGDGTTTGSVVATYNGSWASLNGSVGPLANNRVLIAQITTDGTFCFTLNLQLGTPTPGVSENWVASAPVGNEGTHPSLTYCNTPPINLSVKQNNTNGVNFSVYPNPANNDLTIEINKTSPSANNSYSVYGVDGKVVLSRSIGSVAAGKYQEKVDMSTLSPGMYFVEVVSDGARSTKKVTKN